MIANNKSQMLCAAECRALHSITYKVMELQWAGQGQGQGLW